MKHFFSLFIIGVLFYLPTYSAGPLSLERKNDSMLLQTNKVVLEKINTIDNKLTENDKKIDKLNGKLNDLSEKKNIEIWIPALIGFLAIIFAFIGSYWQTKGNSVSSFRVKWIEDLRNAYGEFYVASQNVGLKQREGRLDLSNDKDLDNMRLLQNKIKLMLNHSEQEHFEFWTTFLTFIERTKILYNTSGNTIQIEQEINDLKLRLEEILLAIFKKEWEKAKRFK